MNETILPRFDVSGVATIEDVVLASDSMVDAIAPNEPPLVIEQLPEGSARWIQTIAETQVFSSYPDEVLKRIYLVIEELQHLHPSALTQSDFATIGEIANVRDYVSHSICDRPRVTRYIAAHLPSAVVEQMPRVKVRYDRSDIEHRNFVGAFEPRARAVMNKLLDAAIATLSLNG